MSMRRVSTILWIGAGLASVEAAGEVIDDIGLKEAVRLMGDAFSAAFPQRDQSAGGNGAAASDTAGTAR